MKHLSPVIAALALMTSGCATTRLSVDARKPSIEVRDTGYYVGGERATKEEVLDALADYEIPVERTIHIRISDPSHLAPARALMYFLAHHGFQNEVLVTDRHAEASVQEPPPVQAPAAPRPIRWK